MSNNQHLNGQEFCDKLENLLFAFVERAVTERATPEEVKALPEVAAVLWDIRRP